MNGNKKNGRKNNSKKPFAAEVLIYCILFLSAEALLGGFALIIQPSGWLLRLPVYLLKSSPFGNYFLPGLFLFVFLGIFPAVVFYGLWKKPKVLKIKDFDADYWLERINIDKTKHWSWAGAVYCAIILQIWINFQIIFMGFFTFMQSFYSFFALCIIFAAVLPQVRNYYSR